MIRKVFPAPGQKTTIGIVQSGSRSPPARRQHRQVKDRPKKAERAEREDNVMYQRHDGRDSALHLNRSETTAEMAGLASIMPRTALVTQLFHLLWADKLRSA